MTESQIFRLTVALVLSWTACAWADEEPRQLQSDTPPQAEVAKTYICPMHPEVRTDQPGRCPKCQMLLEPIRQEEGITVGGGAHQDHGPKESGVLGMVGDYHLELVERDTEFRVYLYDAFTKPISTAGLSGNLVYYAGERTGDRAYEASEIWLPLKPDPANVYLVAAKVPGPEPNEVTVKLQFHGEDLETTFPLDVEPLE